MDSLENIPKKHFFVVPERYFDNLPMEIQRRTETEKGRAMQGMFGYARYAIPALLLTIIVVYSYTRTPDPASMLSSVETDALIQYLEENNVTTEELLNNAAFDPREAEAFEIAIFESNFANNGEKFPDR